MSGGKGAAKTKSSVSCCSGDINVAMRAPLPVLSTFLSHVLGSAVCTWCTRSPVRRSTKRPWAPVVGCRPNQKWTTSRLNHGATKTQRRTRPYANVVQAQPVTLVVRRLESQIAGKVAHLVLCKLVLLQRRDGGRVHGPDAIWKIMNNVVFVTKKLGNE